MPNISYASLPILFQSIETNLTNPAAVFGTSVAAGGSAHTKNTTYTQLIATAAADVYGLMIMFSDVGVNAADSSTLVDIALGAASSEVVLIPNLNAGMAQRTAIGGGQKYWFPLYIPAGSRISATAQSAVGSQAIRTSIWLFENPVGAVWAGTSVTDYGTSLATSRGVSVACGTSAAEGSWTQIVAATTKAHQFVSLGCGGAGDTTAQGGNIFVDLGTGSGGSEVALAQNFPLISQNTEEYGHQFPFSIPSQIPNATRLAARASIVSASAQSIDVIAYGVS